MAGKREREQRKSRQVNASGWAKKSEERGEATAIKLPPGVEFYKLTPGTHSLDFMPYIAGKGNPQADEGFPHFEREFTDHRIPTPDGKSAAYLCLWSNFKKPCPVCKVVNSNSTDEELKKSMKGKLRHLWLVNDKPGDASNKLKVFPSNHYNRGLGFGEMMVDAINSVSQYSDFSDLEKGYTIQLTVKEQSGGGFKYNAVTRLDFLKRDYSYPEEVMDNAPCLDTCLVEQSATFLEKLLNQEVSDDEPEEIEEQEETPPTRKHTRDLFDDEVKPTSINKKVYPKEPEPEEDDDEEVNEAEECGITKGCTVDHEEYGTCEVVHISGDGSSLKLKDGKGKVWNGVDPADCEVLGAISEDEDEEPESPKKNGKKPPVDLDDDEPIPPKKTVTPPKAAKKMTDSDDDMDLDSSDLDSELDEEPEEKPIRKSKR